VSLPAATVLRRCRVCGDQFLIDDQELAFFTAWAKREPHRIVLLPRTCTACRVARRRARLPPVVDDGVDQVLICCGCRVPFTFSATEKRRHAVNRWPPPLRCERCRWARQHQQRARAR
jgi:hypothetical protein